MDKSGAVTLYARQRAGSDVDDRQDEDGLVGVGGGERSARQRRTEHHEGTEGNKETGKSKRVRAVNRRMKERLDEKGEEQL